MGWTTYGKQQLLYYATKVQTSPPTLYAGLWSGTADPAGAGAELTVGGYTRQATAWTLPTPGTIATLADLSFGPLAACTYRGLQILDDPGSGTPWWWADHPGDITVPLNSTVVYPAGGLTVAV